MPYHTIGIVYNAWVAEAQDIARSIAGQLGTGRAPWSCAVMDLEHRKADVEGADLIVTVGGDGTILRTTRVAAPFGVPLLGVNMGRVGFMAELAPSQARSGFAGLLEGVDGWVEERTMLSVETAPDRSTVSAPQPFHALNDALVGRGAVPRLARVEVSIDGVHLTRYTADAVIVATATGSTGYAFSAGGPILHPSTTDLVVTAVAPHISFSGSLVIPATCVIDLTVHTDYQAVLSVDGYVDLGLQDGDSVRIRRSEHRARFLRFHPPEYFYSTVRERLALDNGQPMS